MRSTYLSFTQSPYFNPAFNSAIFDGPLRIYFAQYQESSGLKIYFYMQKHHPSVLSRAKEIHQSTGKNLMILVYPSTDCYKHVFGEALSSLSLGQIEEDDVLAISGPPEEDDLNKIAETACSLMNDWESPTPPSSQPEIA